MLIDIHNRYPRAYIHRHSLQTPATRPTGFRLQGPAEVHALCEDVLKLVKGVEVDSDKVVMHNLIRGKEYTVPRKKIYTACPHIIADNHFSGENVMEYIGKKGFGITTTCRRDRYPPGLKEFVNHLKVPSHDKKTRVARFEQPILAVKHVTTEAPDKNYTRTLVSFQSTGATTITGVNNLLSLRLYVQPKFRGRAGNKFAWATEQNEAREIYLNHYHGIDSADHMIKNLGNRFISWKYWHSPYLHAMSLGIIACYDMYKECCDGGLDPSWKVEIKNRMSFAKFLMRLSEQLLTYDPRNNEYAGDNRLRAATQQPKKRRRSSKDLSDSAESFPDTGVTMTNLKTARLTRRFCTTIDELQHHFAAIQKKTNPGVCEVCGNDKCYYWCSLCDKQMCVVTKRQWTGARCAFLYHNENFFGLSRGDYQEVLKKGWEGGERKKKADIEREMQNWKPATEVAIERNTRYLNRLRLDDASNNGEQG